MGQPTPLHQKKSLHIKHLKEGEHEIFKMYHYIYFTLKINPMRICCSSASEQIYPPSDGYP